MDEKAEPLVTCGQCGAKNRIRPDRAAGEALCGRCKAPLGEGARSSEPGQVYKLRCTECGARNRVRSEGLDSGARCGRCRASLDTAQLFAPQPMMVNDMSFEEKVVRSPLPVLVYAWAPT